SASYPTMVLFPLALGNPVYRFAQQFFDTYITGLTAPVSSGQHPLKTSQMALPFGEAAAVGSDGFLLGSLAEEMAPEVRGSCRIFNAVGLYDEVATVAKEILRLVEDQRMDPIDIGVVARTLDPVFPVIRKVFAENRILY